MLRFNREGLLLSLKPAAAFRPIPPAGDRRAWDSLPGDLRDALSLRAEQALGGPVHPLTARMYLEGEPYLKPLMIRRERLKALALGACAMGAERYIGCIADLLWATMEESNWALPGEHGLTQQPLIDLMAAETAGILALCQALLQRELDALSPAIAARIPLELSRRVFEPLSSESASQLLVTDRELPQAVDHLMAAVLYADADEQRRWLSLRPLISLLEHHLSRALPDGGFRGGLERHMRDVYALSNCLFMLSYASGGEVELRDEAAFQRLCAVPCLLHIGGGWFVNPGGDGPKPDIDPDSLYVLGDGARSGELCQLAAYLARPGVGAAPQAGLLTPPLMHQLLNALYKREFLKEPARSAMRPSCQLPAAQILAARTGDYHIALTGGPVFGGQGHLDVGDFSVFYRGKPVILDPGLRFESGYHSVPRIDGIEQGYLNQNPQEGADCQFDPGYTMLSLGIAHAYPKSAQLVSWQRTLMRTAMEGSIRLMDVVELEHGIRKQLDFLFMTPRKPVPEQGLVLLGDVELRWEGNLMLNIDVVPLTEPALRAAWGDRYYRVVLSTVDRVAGGTFAFLLRGLVASDAE